MSDKEETAVLYSMTIAEFMDYTGCDDLDLTQSILEMAEWNVNTAIAHYRDLFEVSADCTSSRLLDADANANVDTTVGATDIAVGRTVGTTPPPPPPSPQQRRQETAPATPASPAAAARQHRYSSGRGRGRSDDRIRITSSSSRSAAVIPTPPRRYTNSLTDLS